MSADDLINFLSAPPLPPKRTNGNQNGNEASYSRYSNIQQQSGTSMPFMQDLPYPPASSDLTGQSSTYYSNPSLISLSPDDQRKTKQYSHDLEGIDFSLLNHEERCHKRQKSSSAEDVRVEKLYPDISGAFWDVRPGNNKPLSWSFDSSPSCNQPTPYKFPEPSDSRSRWSAPGNSIVQSNPIGFSAFQTSSSFDTPGMLQNNAPMINPPYTDRSVMTDTPNQLAGYSLPRPASYTNLGEFGSYPNSENPQHGNAFSDYGVNLGNPFLSMNSNFQNEPTNYGSDLMTFSPVTVEEFDYLTLDYFDPLIEKARHDSICVRDSEPVLLPSDSISSAGKSGATLIGFESFIVPDSGYEDICDLRTQDNAFHTSQQKQPETEDVFQRIEQPVLQKEIAVTVPQTEATLSPGLRQEQGGPLQGLRKRVYVDTESEAFSYNIVKLKAKYKSTDHKTNLGYVVSPLCTMEISNMSIKLTVFLGEQVSPSVFTCNINTSVDVVISQALYSSSTIQAFSPSDYLLRVYERSEYLLSDHILSKYEYVHSCLKMDKDIKFCVLRKEDVIMPFLRTIDDDSQYLYFPKDYVPVDEGQVSRESLNVLIETLNKETEKLTDAALQGTLEFSNSKSVKQAAKALCSILANVETTEVSKSLERLETAVSYVKYPRKRDSRDVSPDTDQAISFAIKCSSLEEFQESIEALKGAIRQAIKMYCDTFHTDFYLGTHVGPVEDYKNVTGYDDIFIAHISTAHRLPVTWMNTYEEYKIVCSLYHGLRKLGPDVATKLKPFNKSLCDRILWDEWLQFPDVQLNALPREARLCITLCGIKKITSSGNAPEHVLKTPIALGGVSIQLFDHRGHLVQGKQLVPLKMGSNADPYSPSCLTVMPDSVLIQLNLPEFGAVLVFPDVIARKSSEIKEFKLLLPDLQKKIRNIIERDPTKPCSAEETAMLWEYRNYLTEHPELLPRILHGVKSWEWKSLHDIYALLKEWKLNFVLAFQLLLPQYPDIEVRTAAVECLKQMPSDELIQFMPQLIQALKYESYHTSSLAEMLLEQTCQSIRFAHQLFWLLRGAAQDSVYKRRYELIFVALASVAGDSLYKEFRKQEEFVKLVTTAAEKVKTAKDKDQSLKRELENVYELFQTKERLLLPFNPGLEVGGIDLKSCSYFSSNALPLKLVFKNSCKRAEPIYTMFKVGDDLRQDLLTLQMIKIMDTLWLKEKLDLKMLTFACLPTGPNRGMVELITESETLRKIQVSYGVTGSFKERPIKEWLQKHNPTELEYQKAVDNFTRSCAGYCVATYILGICDRHNDNIMLKESGHLFHIDFGKFLGDSQMFGNFKRDRAPFVFTSDMAYVVNDGTKQGDKFQIFVDLCCQAFNIVRRHASLFTSLFLLMSRSGIPGVSERAALYVQKALLPEQTDTQAAATFTRMIEESLKSYFTQFNFFIHNLAQLKFSSHDEGALLSFIPKTYSAQTDGKMTKVQFYGFQKRYTPEKHYIFIIQVQREDQRVPSYIFRLFEEFVEFRDKLASMFPLTKWPQFTTRVVLGRSQIKTVAENRRAEIEKLLAELNHKAAEVKESDLVYTFFHPLLRDEQESSHQNLDVPKVKEPTPPRVHYDNKIHGQVKLSLEYKRDTLHVLVMHAKDIGNGSPSPYIKTYLLPDPNKLTKRKTKVIKNSTHPTYNELIEYPISLEDMSTRILQVTIWNYDVLNYNEFLGAVYINLNDFSHATRITEWYHLQKLQMSDRSSAQF